MGFIIKYCQDKGNYTITSICNCLKITRDAYYKRIKRNVFKEEKHQKVIELIYERREELPREGGKKLYLAIKDELEMNNLKIGRDRLFDILREKDMLIWPKKRYVHTTNSKHRFYKYKSLVKDFTPTAPNQVWVSDITYLRLNKGHCYLALITDAYSRKIIGYDISQSLELAGSLRALKLALRQLPAKHRVIHHSDRGIQYCSNQYVEVLKKHKIRISMTEENHCYENAIAERVNGILKGEFYLDECFTNVELAKKVSKNAIKIYNNKRLHLSLNYKTPNQVHDLAA